MSNIVRKMNRNIIKPGISVGAPTLNVVQVPNIVWTVNGRPRRIYLECFDLPDKTNAQRDAVHLSKVMTDRIFGRKFKEAGEEPVVRPADG